MTEIEKLKSVETGNCFHQAAVSSDGKFVAVVGNDNSVEILTSAGHVIESIRLSALTAEDATVTLAWGQLADTCTLLIASSVGHLLTCASPDFKPVPVQIRAKLTTRNFQKISICKSGRDAVVASDCEIVWLTRRGEMGQFEGTPRASPFTLDGGSDTVLSLDMHPAGSVVALTSVSRKSVLIIARDGSRSELTDQLRKRPTEMADDECAPVTEPEGDEREQILPSVVNEVVLSSARLPVACAWSKYGDTLAVDSSDNLLSFWSVPGGTMETVAVGESTTVIRNICFLNDVFVAVSINDANRVLIVNIDDGVLYDSSELAERGSGIGSKNASLDVALSKAKLLIFRPDDACSALAKWQLAL